MYRLASASYSFLMEWSTWPIIHLRRNREDKKPPALRRGVFDSVGFPLRLVSLFGYNPDITGVIISVSSHFDLIGFTSVKNDFW